MRSRRKNTVAQAKNAMRRAIREIVDPGPASVEPVWEYFESFCAYCGRKLDRSLREGDIDHADPVGGNHLGNLVLACRSCNADEKRDEGWHEFVLRKNPDPVERKKREARILAWIKSHPPRRRPDSPTIQRRLAELDNLVEGFGGKCVELKGAIKEAGENPTS